MVLRELLKTQGHTAISFVERRVKTKRIQQICQIQTILHPQKAHFDDAEDLARSNIKSKINKPSTIRDRLEK